MFGHGYNGWFGNAMGKNNVSTTESYAVYGRVTEKVNDKFTITGGLRYNWDKIGWNYTSIFNPPTGDVYTCNPLFSAANPTGDGGNGPPSGCTWNLSNSSGTLVGDLALQYHPDRDTMIYATYTRGYKPAAYNTAHDFNSSQAGGVIFPGSTPQEIAYTTALSAADHQLFATPAKEENIDSFELGLKSSLMNHHLTFNAAAFYTFYHN